MSDPLGAPVSCPWGAAPQPIPEEPKRSSWFGSSMVALVMFGWMVLMLGLSALVARNDPNVEVPTQVGLGVVVTPADGWYSAADRWDVGENAVALQSAGVLAAFWVEQFKGTNDEYLTAWLGDLGQQFDQFRPLPAAPVTVARDVPGLTVYFSAVSGSLGREDDVLVVATHGGIGVAMWVRAEPGRLAWVQDDLNYMLYHLAMPR